MRGYEYIAYGGPEVLRLTQRPDPGAAPGELVVEVRAIGLNPVDILQRRGAFRFTSPLRVPFVPGNEFAGTVSAVGADVAGFQIGDRVFARSDKGRLGALAERVAIRAELVAHMPRTASFTTAAAVPLAGTTALQAVTRALAVTADDTVLITAGSSMVGMFAIQIAAATGAHVATTASARNTAALRALGAARVFDYRQHPDHEIPGTYTKLLDLVPGANLRSLLGRVEAGGRLVSVAATPTPGSIRHDYDMPAWRGFALDAALSVLTAPIRRRARGRSITYQRLSMRPDGADLRTLADLVDRDALDVTIDSHFDFTDAPAAFDRIEGGHALGKVVIELEP
ncbi:NADP-dependent oxidoreductase [Promicromonospora aerolata]|uniref:NADP-dependent oxidoreductase n=1 Tax=Promicromonospora aerolata TaxID=195749 RepID=A0ABW4V4H7_9MICO